jgi:hypothetical protein
MEGDVLFSIFNWIRMMEKLFLSMLIAGLILSISLGEEKSQMEQYFPDIEGFCKKGQPDIYTPETLYEYINGAAELYLDYQFKELAVFIYETEEHASIAVEIYRFENPDCSFGIYARERSGYTGDFIKAGTQGYYEQGVLNFLKDSFYVKMNAFELNDRAPLLIRTAEEIAALLPGKAEFPAVFNIFPAHGKDENSQQYLAKNFLGYDFFSNAFTADYTLPDSPGMEKFTLFMIRCRNRDECGYTLKKYLDYIKQPEPELKEGRYSINDPYYGPVELLFKGKNIWGMFGLTNDELRRKYWEFIITHL